MENRGTAASDHGLSLRAEAIHFGVAGRSILNNVSLDFAAGAITGLIGHNGSGKSTLLKILARQIAPQTGRVTLGGDVISTIPARAFSRKIAYLPQDFGAGTGMLVRELVACGRYPWHGVLGRFTDLDRQKVEQAIAMTHLESLAERAVDTLSGGERQRAWIAMLMAQDARCLLLDEPTSALDIAHQVELLSLIRRLAHERALSVVMVLHDINMAARFCDHIHALSGGEVVASGAPGEILDPECLQRIYGIQMGVTRYPGGVLPIAYVQ